MKLPLRGMLECSFGDATYFEWPTQAQFESMPSGVFMSGLTCGAGSVPTHVTQLVIHLSSGEDSEKIGDSHVKQSMRRGISDPTDLRAVDFFQSNEEGR